MDKQLKIQQEHLLSAIGTLEKLICCAYCCSKKRVNHWVDKVKICHNCYNKMWMKEKRSKK